MESEGAAKADIQWLKESLERLERQISHMPDQVGQATAIVVGPLRDSINDIKTDTHDHEKRIRTLELFQAKVITIGSGLLILEGILEYWLTRMH